MSYSNFRGDILHNNFSGDILHNNVVDGGYDPCGYNNFIGQSLPLPVKMLLFAGALIGGVLIAKKLKLMT